MPLAIRPRSGPINSRSRKDRNKRTTNLVTNLPPDANPVLITQIDINSPVMTVVFDQAVTVNGVPAFTTDIAGPTVTGCSQEAPNAVELTFSAAITGATTLNIPFRDPAIRGASGGYVTATSHVIA